jgi:hypothetical protein
MTSLPAIVLTIAALSWNGAAWMAYLEGAWPRRPTVGFALRSLTIGLLLGLALVTALLAIAGWASHWWAWTLAPLLASAYPAWALWRRPKQAEVPARQADGA